MPYVPQALRRKIGPHILPLLNILRQASKTPDELDANLNYIITTLLIDCYGQGGYAQRANALKVLIAVMLEYYRRNMASYEDIKKLEHGDLFNGT